MGLFDMIGGKINEVKEAEKEAEREAQRWDARKICQAIERTSSTAKSMGYMKVLHEKCKEMDDTQLERVFDEAYNNRNGKAVSLSNRTLWAEENADCFRRLCG